MNIGIKVELNVNGAVLIPTNEQFNKIKRAVSDIVFNGADDVEMRKSKRYTTKRTISHWTDEEYEFMLTQFKQGHKFADIADQLTRRFGTNRTKASVQQRISKFVKKQMPQSILDKFMGTPVMQGQTYENN